MTDIDSLGASSRELLSLPRAYVRASASVLRALPDLRDAIDAFEPVAHPAGESVAMWLREDALREPQEAAVRLRLSHGRVTGAYALCAAQIALGQRERLRLGGLRYRTQPAILLAQFARAAGSPGIGEEMLKHATAVAHESTRYVAASVLVVDPFDAATAAMWRERFGFQDSRHPVPGNPGLNRMWISL